jgi:hypothetical protein
MGSISWADLMQAVGTEAANSYNGIIPLIKNQVVRQVSLSRVPRESTTSVVTGLRAGQFPIVPAGTPALPTKIASPVFQRGHNDSIWPLVTEGIPEAFFKQAPAPCRWIIQKSCHLTGSSALT